MYESPGRGYFESLKHVSGFTRDPLEKMYRMVDLLKKMDRVEDVGMKLALKGGTAIQLMFFGLSRLSVDIDLNYVGSLDKNIMQADRKIIRELLTKIFREEGYTMVDDKNMYALEQFELRYTGVAGNMDRLKVEINYIERMPVLPLKRTVLSHPFEPLGEVAFQTYALEEHMAMKIRALMTRGMPRDLYDIYQMIGMGIDFDKEALRKLTLFYLMLAPVDVRTLQLAQVREIDKSAVSAHLSPLLKREERGIDPEWMKGLVIPMLETILDLNDRETAVMDVFYDEQRFVQELLFEDVDIAGNLNEHPSMQWRLIRLRDPDDPEEL